VPELDLIDKPAAQAASVYLLQSDQIILAQYLGNFVQRTVALPMRQQMLPAARDIMMICLRIDPNLNVETEQFQAVSGVTGRFAMVGSRTWDGGILRDRGWLLHDGGTALLNEVVSS